MIEIASALLLGFAFGWLLHKAGLTHYERIVGVYRLRDMTVIQFMLTALVVATVLVQASVDLGLSRTLPVPAAFLVANLVGGLLFGIGMATSGYCTGTVVAQAGEGRLDAILGGLPGLIVGAIVFGLLEPHVMPVITRVAPLGRTTLPALLGANPWLVILVFGELVVVALYAIARSGRRMPTHQEEDHDEAGTSVALPAATRRTCPKRVDAHVLRAGARGELPQSSFRIPLQRRRNG